MTDGALSWLAMVAAAYLRDGRVPGRGDGQLNGGFLCYYPYEASDGWVTCGALEPKFWRAFCEGVGREDLIEAQFQPPGSDAWRQVADVWRGVGMMAARRWLCGARHRRTAPDADGAGGPMPRASPATPGGRA